MCIYITGNKQRGKIVTLCNQDTELELCLNKRRMNILFTTPSSSKDPASSSAKVAVTF